MSTNYINNSLFIEKVKIETLVKNNLTPFYVYSSDSIKENFNLLKKNLGKNIYYSVKANSNQTIISLLSGLGSGFDVVSEEELIRVLKINVDPKKIIFEGVGKTDQAIKIAIEKEIKQINIESINEIKIINNIAKKLNKRINIGIRINPDIDAKTNYKITTGTKCNKFGIDIKDLYKAIDLVQLSKNLKMSGISCHLGSQIFSIKVFENLFIKMKKIVEILEKRKISIKNLDLGGGMGVDQNNNQKFKISSLGKIVKKYFGNVKYEISFEPGRFLIANSGILISKVLMTKKTGNINFAIIDAGMNTFMRPALYNAFHKIIPIKKKKSTQKYTVAGPICETSDIFYKNIMLSKLSIGDFVAILNTGAYGSVMSSNYNSKILPAELIVSGNRYETIRFSQNIIELISKDKVPYWINDI